MNKLKKDLLILFSLVALCFGIWFYIWSNLLDVVAEYKTNYTGVVKYAWRWEQLPIQIEISPELNISDEELRIVAAHFNFFFQSRNHSDLIEFVKKGKKNVAYLAIEKHLPKEMFAYTIKEGVNNRPSIFLSDRYLTWEPKKRMSIIMHEIGHLIGLPHFEYGDSLMKSTQKNPITAYLTDVEQELIHILYKHQLGNVLIGP